VTSRLRLPKTARLLTGRQFRSVFEHGRRTGNALFRVHFVAAKEARLGLAVSRKVDRRAVLRNRIRRQIREAFRLWRAKLPPLDCVVVAAPAAARSDDSTRRQAIEELWSRLSNPTSMN